MATVEDGPWVLKVLRRIAAHPAGRLGGERAFSVVLFLMAYGQARIDLGLPEFAPEDEAILCGFVRFLERRTGRTDTRGWWGLIEHLDDSDRNVHTLFRLFDEYARSELGVGILQKPL